MVHRDRGGDEDDGGDGRGAIGEEVFGFEGVAPGGLVCQPAQLGRPFLKGGRLAEDEDVSADLVTDLLEAELFLEDGVPRIVQEKFDVVDVSVAGVLVAGVLALRSQATDILQV